MGVCCSWHIVDHCGKIVVFEKKNNFMHLFLLHYYAYSLSTSCVARIIVGKILQAWGWSKWHCNFVLPVFRNAGESVVFTKLGLSKCFPMLPHPNSSIEKCPAIWKASLNERTAPIRIKVWINAKINTVPLVRSCKLILCFFPSTRYRCALCYRFTVPEHSTAGSACREVS